MLGSILSTIPSQLIVELEQAYNNIEINFRESRWEPSELNGGKFCEVVYCIIEGYLSGSFPNNVSKPRNMVDACNNLQSYPNTFPRSLRIQIPRMIIALYEIRNNRGVGHVGGDVQPNHMDAICVFQMAKWILAELIRVFHNVDTTDAQNIVNSISEKEIGLVWEIENTKRVLNPNLSYKKQMLLIVYSNNGPASEKDLLHSIEHSNPSVFRRDVLRKAHKERLIEYNEEKKTITLSPLGVSFVETHVLSA